MTMTDPGTELITRPAGLLQPTPEAAREAMETYQAISQALIDRDNDIQVIRTKSGPREFPKRSAFQKLANAYRVSTEIVREQIDYDDDGKILRARVVVRATHPDGRYSEGDGACSRDEDRFAKGGEKIDHDLPATAVTRAKNRAISDLVAFGAVSAEEASATAEAGVGPGPSAAPPWAAPVSDISGVAQALTNLFKHTGVAEPAKATGKVGQAIFDDCGDIIPLAVARVIGHIADVIREGGVVDAEAAADTAAEAPSEAQDAQSEPDPTPDTQEL